MSTADLIYEKARKLPSDLQSEAQAWEELARRTQDLPSSMRLTEADIFAEMEPFTVKVGGADYSRQSLYTRMEGE